MNTKNKKEKRLYRGSVWRKWDLHVHTPFSFYYEYRGKDWVDKVIQKINESEVSVFAITDYFSLDGYKELSKYLKKIKKTLFPGIELRLESLIGSRKDKKVGTKDRPINLQIIFSNNPNLFPKIEEFVSSLEFEDFSGNKNYLNRPNIVKIGKSMDISLPEEEAYKKGCENIRISKDLVEKKIREKGLLDHCLIVLPYEKYGGIDPIDPDRDSLIKSRLTKLANILETSNATQIEFFLGRSKKLPFLLPSGKINKKFEMFIGMPKPCINISDSHHPDTIGKFPKNKCCWIKADTTFEGLKQIIYEPEERVYIGDENPRSFSQSWLESFEVEDDFSKRFFIKKNNPIYFNPGLNVLIGARGSGKSVLLDSLILSSDQSRINRDSYISNFLKKNKKSTLACYLQTKGGSAGQLVKYEWKGEKQIERFPCDYFFQKEIGKIAEGRNEEEKITLSDFIFKHIFAEFAKDILEKLESSKNKILSDLKRNRHDINDQENLIRKEQEVVKKLSDLRKQEKSYSQKELKELYDERGQIINLQEVLSESIDSIDVKIKEYKDFLKRFNVSSIKEIEKVFEIDFVDQGLKENFKKNFTKIILDLETSVKVPPSILIKAQELLKSYSQKLRLDERYKKIQKEMRDKSQELEVEFSEELDKQVNKIQNQIARLKSQKIKILKAKELKKELIKQREVLLDRYLKQLNNTEGLLRKAFVSFCKQEGSALKDSIRIDFYKDVGNEDYIEVIEKRKELIDIERSRKFPKPQLQKIFEKEQNIQNIIKIFRERVFKQWEKIEGVGPETSSYLEKIKNIEEIVLLLEETLPSLRATIQWKDQKGNYKPLSECSVGERSTAVLSIILVSGRTPLLIDQPEDDLDNFYIFERLVPIIKTVKKRRQLIFATHDANIVVNADAELIFILKSPDGKHAEIEPATIENMEKRNDIITILEGGAKAFARREKRLRGPT